jgi:hypothetical protein
MFGHHILALESNMKVFEEVLKPMVVIAMFEAEPPTYTTLTLNFLSKIISRGSLNVSKFASCFMILCCFPIFCVDFPYSVIQFCL